MDASGMGIATNTIVGLGLVNPCSQATAAPSTGCTVFSSSSYVSRVNGAPPATVLLVSASGASTLTNRDAVNIIALNCDQPRALGVVGTAVVWQAVDTPLLPPTWIVVLQAPAGTGAAVTAGARVLLVHAETKLTLALNTASERLVVASVPRDAQCVGPALAGGVVPAYFFFTPPGRVITQQWVIPNWLPSWFPYWYQPIPGWWPSWWVPGRDGCPPWVPGCPGYAPPRNPCDTRGPKPAWCPNAITNPCWLPEELRPAYCHHGTHACQSRNPPAWCKPGSDADWRGCKRSAGYTWCPELGRCCQPWKPHPHPAPNPDPVPPRPAPNPTPLSPLPSHGCEPGFGWDESRGCCFNSRTNTCQGLLGSTLAHRGSGGGSGDMMHTVMGMNPASMPWTPIPGSSLTGANPGSSPPGTVPTHAPNQTPAWGNFPLTPGVPWKVRLAGSPSAIPVFSPLPSGVVRAFNLQTLLGSSRDAVAHSDFLFDFTSLTNRQGNGVAEGEMAAYGASGAAPGCGRTIQASLAFRYRWCGPQVCDDVELPRFEVLSCRSRSARFTVLDDSSFISDDPCTESIVVLLVQQYCPCLPEADTTVTPLAQGQPEEECRITLDAVSCAAARVLAPCAPA